MPVSKRKLEKRKKREKEGKQKALNRRLANVVKKAEENRERKREQRLIKLHNELLSMDQHIDPEKLVALDDKAISQLEKNVVILKGLENEFEEEQKKRDQLNEELEESGHVTLDQKLKAIQENTIAQQKVEAQVGVGGSADCCMKANDSPDSSVNEDQIVS